MSSDVIVDPGLDPEVRARAAGVCPLLALQNSRSGLQLPFARSLYIGVASSARYGRQFDVRQLGDDRGEGRGVASAAALLPLPQHRSPSYADP